MGYIQLNCLIDEKEPFAQDIISAFLSDLGFDSFEQTKIGVETYVNCYIKEELLDKKQVDSCLTDLSFIRSYEFFTMEEKNWNEEWEKNYPKVEISDECVVVAPFHNQKEGTYKYRIIIEPQMSFGTAHHETTSQMMQLLLEEEENEIAKKSILDMGSGTGVLAILAHMMGAREIEAIDNDTWAYQNCLHNCQLNHIDDITISLGDATQLEGKHFGFILANINRNILINDMKYYANALAEGGTICMSGFYKSDLPLIVEEGKKQGFKLCKTMEKNRWIAAKFKKYKLDK